MRTWVQKEENDLVVGRRRIAITVKKSAWWEDEDPNGRGKNIG